MIFFTLSKENIINAFYADLNIRMPCILEYYFKSEKMKT